MASSTSSPPPPPPPPPRPQPTRNNDEMPSVSELKDIATRALQMGAATGAIGTFVGAGSGILRAAPPTLFAVVAGLQWFALGSSYTASKELLWHAWGGEQNLKPSELVMASGVAGGVSGMVGGMFRGPRNILPGIVFFSALGAGSSFASQRLKSNTVTQEAAKKSWMDSKWSPLTRLSDRDYEKRLEEKLLRLDADIAIIDEHIASLRASSLSKEPTETAKPNGSR